MSELFPLDSQRFDSEETGETAEEWIFIMVEAVEPTDGSLWTLFTIEHFQEMTEFEDFLMNDLTAPDYLMEQLTVDTPPNLYDLCKKKSITDEIVEQFAAENCEYDESFCLPEVDQKCASTSKPIDFIYNRMTDTFDLSPYRSDEELIARI